MCPELYKLVKILTNNDKLLCQQLINGTYHEEWFLFNLMYGFIYKLNA